MPLIPRLQPSETGPAAAPVLDRERRPTVDSREVAQAADNLASVRQPLVNGSAMAAPFDALGSIGRAVMETGGILGALAIKQREAESDMQVADAQSRMETSRAEFETWAMTDTNPGGWSAAWDERWNESTSAILADEKLNEGARRRIGLTIADYGGKMKVDVAKSAVKRTFKMLGDSYNARMMRAHAQKDYGREMELAREAQGKGLLWEDQVAGIEIEIEKAKKADAREARLNGVISAVKTSGYAATADSINDPKYGAGADVDEEEKQALLQAARRTANGMEADVADDAANWMAQNPTATAAEVRARYGANMSPAELEKWAGAASERQKTARMAYLARPEVTDANFARLMDEAKAFDTSADDWSSEYARIHREVASLLPEGLRGDVTQIIETKRRSVGKLPPLDPVTVSTANDMIEGRFRSGGFGQFMAPDGKGGYKENPKEKEKALAKKGAVLRGIREALKDPAVTPAQLSGIIDELTNGQAPTMRFTTPPTGLSREEYPFDEQGNYDEDAAARSEKRFK